MSMIYGMNFDLYDFHVYACHYDFIRFCLIHVRFPRVFSVSTQSAENMVGLSSTALDGWNSNRDLSWEDHLK